MPMIPCLVLSCALAASVFGAESDGTNKPLTSLQRLEHAHLQAAHEARLRFQHQRVGNTIPNHGLYNDFHAVIYVHTGDGDSTKGTRDALLSAARRAGVHVVMIAQPQGSKADVWRGLHDGVLFITGAETVEGSLWFQDYDGDGKVIPASGVRFLSHVEKTNPNTDGIVGMEICHRHADAKLDKSVEGYLTAAAADTGRWESINEDFRAFPDEFFAANQEFQQEEFSTWDQETQKKPFTGIAAIDAHRSVVMKGVTFDPYEIRFRHLVTHIMAQELTEPLIREALNNGHVYVAHDWLCDPSGFVFGAVNNLGVFSMGDAAPMQGRTRLTALTPVAAKLKLIHNGSVIEETTGTNLTFEAKEPGPYRIEAWLTVDGEDRPWIFSNPVYLKSPSPAEMRLPSMALSDEVEARKNITYFEGDEADAAKHKLDVYLPKGATNCPVFFFIHGGAWKSGDRSYYPPLGNRYSRAGFITVVPSYRLAPRHPHPAQIEDVAAAFAWTAKHIVEYGADTSQIYVGGHSAGGHLAALLGLDPKYLQKYNLSPRLIRGVLALSGVYNLSRGESQDSVFGSDPAFRREASPLFHVNNPAPPFLVTYCQYDYFSLPAQAREFHRALHSAGVASQLVYVPGQNHISEMVNVASEDDPLVAAALKFMKTRPVAALKP